MANIVQEFIVEDGRNHSTAYIHVPMEINEWIHIVAVKARQHILRQKRIHRIANASTNIPQSNVGRCEMFMLVVCSMRSRCQTLCCLYAIKAGSAIYQHMKINSFATFLLCKERN